MWGENDPKSKRHNLDKQSYHRRQIAIAKKMYILMSKSSHPTIANLYIVSSLYDNLKDLFKQPSIYTHFGLELG